MSDTREILVRELLQKIANEHKYDNPVIETAVVPSTGSNFTSQLFHATIRTSEQELNVFAKIGVVPESVREQIDFNMFDTEQYFFTKLAKAYKEIEDKHNVPDEYKLVIPKLYGYSDDYTKETLVFEDLSKYGFVIYDRLKSIDWDYASKAVEEMAKLHALSIAYQMEYPEDYQEATKVLKRMMFDGDSVITDMFKQSVEKVILMIREENVPKLQKFFSETFNPEIYLKFYQPKRRPVIVHSDYRPSNLMHKVDEDGRLQLIVVDYQTLHPGCFAVDLLYFIFTGSDGAFRAQYYDQLIEHYYQHVTAALKRLDMDPEEVFPRADFDEELKEMLPFGLLVSTMTLPLITADVETVAKMEGTDYENRNLESMAEMMGEVNAMCVQRLNDVVDDYVQWGIL